MARKKKPSMEEVLDAAGRWFKHTYGTAELKKAGLPTSDIEVGKRLKAMLPPKAFKEIVDEIAEYPVWQAGAILPVVSMHRGDRRGDYRTFGEGFHWIVRSQQGLDMDRMGKTLWTVGWGVDGPWEVGADQWHDTKEEAVMNMRVIMARIRAGERVR